MWCYCKKLFFKAAALVKWFLKGMRMVYWKPYSPKPWKEESLATQKADGAQSQKCLGKYSCMWWTVPRWACILGPPSPFHCVRKYISLLCYFIHTGSTCRKEKMPFWQTMTGALPYFVAWTGSGVCVCARAWVCMYGFVCACWLNAYSVELWHPVRSRHLFF